MNAAIDQGRLVAALARRLDSGSGHEAPRTLETHISYVLLTGAHAFKIKKAVAFPFLDFRTLEARRTFCEQELRLNRRHAADLYLEVVPITGSMDAPVLGGTGPAIEYAVKMREFPQDALASALIKQGRLGPADIDALAATIARFHGAVDVAGATSGFGTPAGILELAQRNLAEIDAMIGNDPERRELAALLAWTQREHAVRHDVFQRRRDQGFVRECHGDLHLGNIARVGGELVVFDALEFNDELRWIDTMSEVAFTVMDLEDRGRADLAHRFLNAYLERTGDYAGLEVLAFYLVYRALVRAKVALLRAAQKGSGVSAAREEARGYLELAAKYARPARPALIVTCGLSGSGKTTISQAVLERLGAVRVRSDVERKRMSGMAPLERAVTELDRGLYAPQTTQATYDRLRHLARCIVEAGWTVIVDATFLKRQQRQVFRALAAELDAPFVILALEAEEARLRERIAQRRVRGADASDADLAVLAHQMATREALTLGELACAVVWNAEAASEAARAPGPWVELVDRLRGFRGTSAPSAPLPC